MIHEAILDVYFISVFKRVAVHVLFSKIFQKSFDQTCSLYLLSYWQLAKAKGTIWQKKADSCNVLKGLLLPTDTRASGLTLGEHTHSRLLSRDRFSRGRY